jgi:uncharacterized membrane protein
VLTVVAKALHVLGAVLFLGAGLMTAWYKVRADRSGDLRIVAWCQREIVRADWLFTLPSALLLPATGALLVRGYRLPWSTDWVLAGLAGYVAAGALWLPAVWLQLRMRALADAALRDGTALPPAFHRLNRVWLALGAPAFLIAAATVWFMVAKRVG